MELARYWDDGALLCRFEPGVEDVRSGAVPDVLREHVKAGGMRTEPGDDVPTAPEAPLLLAERLTGITADRTLVVGPARPAGLLT